MADYSLIEAVKYGAAGIAGISIIVTASLLQRELKRDEIRGDARKILVTFMVFAFAMMAFCGVLAVYESSSKIDLADVAKLTKIRSIASSMDASLLGKVLADNQIKNSPGINGVIRGFIRSMCDDVGQIGAETGDPTLGSKCKQGIQ
jgi:hypothetical protein